MYYMMELCARGSEIGLLYPFERNDTQRLLWNEIANMAKHDSNFYKFNKVVPI
jgi:hypothetical protein